MDKNWKKMERRVARILGGERIPVADKRSRADVITKEILVECKFRTKDVGTGLVYEWLKKIRSIAEKEEKLGILVFKKKGHGYKDVAVMDLRDFKRFLSEKRN